MKYSRIVGFPKRFNTFVQQEGILEAWLCTLNKKQLSTSGNRQSHDLVLNIFLNFLSTNYTKAMSCRSYYAAFRLMLCKLLINNSTDEF